MDGQLHIDQMFAFVALDKDGTEGVVATMKEGVYYPLVGADMERVESLKPMAEKLAEQLGVPVTLLKFSVREEIETILPKETTGAEPQEARLLDKFAGVPSRTGW